jgi:hypothetical protein
MDCISCAFWRPLSDEEVEKIGVSDRLKAGRCHCHAPCSRSLLDNDLTWVQYTWATWPMTVYTDGCGEFRAKHG